MDQVCEAAINGYPTKCQENRLALACCTGLAFQAYKIHHAMAAAGRSDHQRPMAVFTCGVQCGHQVCGIDAADARQQLIAAQHDGNDILEIKIAQQTEKIHGPGFSGMGAYVFRLRAIIRADEIGVADKCLAGFSPDCIRHLG